MVVKLSKKTTEIFDLVGWKVVEQIFRKFVVWANAPQVFYRKKLCIASLTKESVNSQIFQALEE